MNIDQLIKFDQKNDPKHSGTSVGEKMFLYGIIRTMTPDKVVEIGSWKGHSAVWIAQALTHNKRGRLICVDDWKGTNGGAGGSKKHVHVRLVKAGLINVVDLIQSDSVEWMSSQRSNSIDIVWVDGRHDYEGQKRDIEEALRIASRLVIVHDAFNFKDVTKACDEIGNGTWIEGFRGMWLRSKR